MQFNSEANGLDIVSDTHFLAGTDSTVYTTAEITRNSNYALDRIVTLIMRADQKWKWDDNNNTDLPIGTTALVAEQADYSMAVTHLKLLRLRAKDSAGNFRVLTPVERRDLTDAQLNAPSGTPLRYYKVGASLFLNPMPSYASAAGLEIQVQRGASYFGVSDTTKVPGIPAQFHRLIPLYNALDYCMTNTITDRIKGIQDRIDKMENELVEFFAQRNPDEKQGLRVRHDDYGESALGSLGQGSPRNPDRWW